jgi:Holliday junction resolvasome RuvABC endonuclease subunit
MIVLAIDPGSSCGYALGDDSGVLNSGVWQLAPARGESPGMRYIRFRAQLNIMHTAWPALSLVAYEAAHHRGGASTQYALGIQSHIESWCAYHEIEHMTIHSARLKKWATGVGNASKATMVRLGCARFGKPADTSDDEIDALWILAYAKEMVGK